MVVGDAHQLPFSDESFQAVLMEEVLEHCSQPWKAIEEAHRFLVPNGLLLLTTRFLFPIHGAPEDFFRFTFYGIEHLLRDRFDERVIAPHGNLYDTFLTLWANLVHERGLMRWLSPLVILTAIAGKRVRLVNRLCTTHGYTSGYLVAARKNSDHNGGHESIELPNAESGTSRFTAIREKVASGGEERSCR